MTSPHERFGGKERQERGKGMLSFFCFQAKEQLLDRKIEFNT